MSLNNLVAMSNKYGADPEYVLAGGGNTSYKENNCIYVKSSGTTLATITAEEFAQVDMQKLAAMLTKDYPKEDAPREAAALADLMDARLETSKDKRPSVETILHSLFPYHYVLHVHPPMVNGLTCSKQGEQMAKELFGNTFVWIPICRPGYILSLTCKAAMEEYANLYGTYPKLVLLQNHGIFVAADTVEEIDEILADVMQKLSNTIQLRPDFSACDTDEPTVHGIENQLKALYTSIESGSDVQVLFTCNKQVQSYLKDETTFAPLAKPFTPDHIVYYKAEVLYCQNTDALSKEFTHFYEANGYAPKIVAVKDLGFFSLGKIAKEAQTAQTLFIDAIKIAVFSESFGGPLTMTDELMHFITNWETESYRQSVSLK